mmetsp:Transcript_147/g.456  ORF Transcript_147/g.456 Transcript_147/m.456 type:complete len:950 (-) Transcript_147:248-3097(-)
MAEIEWSGNKVRQTYIDFFVKQKGHTFVPSSSVVPHEDPTLLFANAGMNQFKPIFVGDITPGTDMETWKRATNSQKCIRAGGKHNDLEDVGRDVYHHTFFEMLGNWSFGDYFKAEAIDWSWELLTKVYGLDPDRLYATYFGGSEKDGLPSDDEAKELWCRYLPPSRVLPFDAKDNFWEMGETGPCGPCAEIHYDRIGGRDASALVNMDDPNVLEIWNLVFMQFNREKDGSLRTLPNKHIDTGMGLERVTSILQNKTSNYDTDLFTFIFEEIQKITGCRAYTGKLGAEDADRVDFTYRVVGDHIRTLTFAVADGAVPGPDGREYVLRRILRRAVRYGREFLKAPQGFFSTLSSKVVEQFGDAFPELRPRAERIQTILEREERTFSKTLDKGIQKFLKFAEAGNLSGADAFMLYDTYGFPLDLTQLMAEERNLTVDIVGYEAAMKRQKEQSKKKTSDGDGSVEIVLQAEQTAALSGPMGVPPTNDEPKYDWVSTGSGPDLTAKVCAIWTGKEWVDKTADDAVVGIILDTTTFYAEAGGQIYDIGTLTGDGGKQTVTDCKKFGPYVVHIGAVYSGSLSVGEEVAVSVDYERRAPIGANHSATHALNCALRTVLGGEGLDQRGSMVSEERLRFDFSWDKPVSAEECAKIENVVQALIDLKPQVYRQTCGLAEARRISSLRAVFGEVYPDPVRVVSIGKPIDAMLANPDSEEWLGWSVEFCGGTHLDNFGEALRFAIVAEEGISKGVRRLVAVTGAAATKAHDTATAFELRAAKAEGLSAKEMEKEITAISGEISTSVLPVARADALRKKLHSMKDAVVAAAKAELAAAQLRAKEWASETLLAAAEGAPVVGNLPVNGDVKALLFATASFDNRNPVFVLSGDQTKGLVNCVAIVPKTLTAKLDAKEWLTHVMSAVGGKGGGKADKAQGNAPGAIGKEDSMAAAAAEFGKMKLGC